MSKKSKLSKPVGQPPKLNKEIQEKIVNQLRLGNYFNVACEVSGISPSVATEWRTRGEGRDPDRPCKPIYAEFAAACTKAIAEGEASALLRIKKVARGGEVISRKTTTKIGRDGEETTVTEEDYTRPEWTADAWFLERKFPERWGRKDRVDLNVNPSKPISDMTDEELAEFAATLDAEIAGRTGTKA